MRGEGSNVCSEKEEGKPVDFRHPDPLQAYTEDLVVADSAPNRRSSVISAGTGSSSSRNDAKRDEHEGSVTHDSSFQSSREVLPGENLEDGEFRRSERRDCFGEEDGGDNLRGWKNIKQVPTVPLNTEFNSVLKYGLKMRLAPK